MQRIANPYTGLKPWVGSIPTSSAILQKDSLISMGSFCLCGRFGGDVQGADPDGRDNIRFWIFQISKNVVFVKYILQIYWFLKNANHHTALVWNGEAVVSNVSV